MREVTRLRDAYVSVFNETVNTVELDDADARQMMLTETMPALRAMLNALDQLVVLPSARANDTMEGIPEAVEAGKTLGIRVIPGVEMTAHFHDQELHILGYFADDGG